MDLQMSRQKVPRKKSILSLKRAKMTQIRKLKTVHKARRKRKTIMPLKITKKSLKTCKMDSKNPKIKQIKVQRQSRTNHLKLRKVRLQRQKNQMVIILSISHNRHPNKGRNCHQFIKIKVETKRDQETLTAPIPSRNQTKNQVHPSQLRKRTTLRRKTSKITIVE